MAQDKPTLIYIGDPMCSWCYGFYPELDKAIEQLGTTVHLQMIMGGLRPYNKETMSDLSSMLREHWRHVNHSSGQAFSYDILENESFVYDTEPPCRAVLVVRRLAPEKEFEFFKALQRAFYLEGKNTNEIETYLDLAEKFGLDREAFRKDFESEQMKKAIKVDFQMASNMGISGFPSVIFKHEGQYFLIARGYQKAEVLVDSIKKIMDN